MSLSRVSTDELLSALARSARRPRRVRLGGLDEAAGLLEGAYRRASQLAQVASASVIDAASAPFAQVYSRLKHGALDLAETAGELARRGILVESQIVDELGRRAWNFADGLADFGAAALGKAGEGLGDLAENFWGLPPWGLLLAGLLVVAGGGYLLISPGGQALLSGASKAIASGGGEFLAGGGRALSTVALRM